MAERSGFEPLVPVRPLCFRVGLLTFMGRLGWTEAIAKRATLLFDKWQPPDGLKSRRTMRAVTARAA
jgi:hypothetical protein